MTKPIKSRHGLTRCGACRAHIRAEERPSATVCPFCGANLLAPGAVATAAGRGGVLAASLLAFSALGCGGGQAATSDDQTVSADDNTNQPPPDDAPDQYEPEPAPDNTAVAEYGVSPDDYESEPAEDPRPTPRYGLPPSRR